MNPLTRKASPGFSLIEVLIAVVVLSFGLLALASFQAGLFRAGAESKARAVATARAQDAVESLRAFRQLTSASGVVAFQDIVSGPITSETIDGTTFYGCRQVRRYRFDRASGRFVRLNDVTPMGSMFAASGGTVSVTCEDSGVVAAATQVGTAEFKEVRIAIAWIDATGLLKTVELTDTISSVSPADQAALAKDKNINRQSPTVFIRPPNRNEDGSLIPEVVPIAVSDSGDVASASSNPKPEQFVEDLSAVTLFSVKTFTGTDPTEVQLNRNIDVAVASCICRDSGATSSSSSPAYQPTEWNGKLQAYAEPAAARHGKKVGTAIVANSDRQISNLCTICCRDHHDDSAQTLKVDPWRPLENGAHAHYGFQRQGGNYNLAAGLLPVGASTGSEYVEACRMVRVNGRMRLAVDGLMNYMAIAPLNSGGSAFQNATFSADYGSLVGEYVKTAVNSVVAGSVVGYPGPDAALPGPSAALLAATSPKNYALIDQPATIAFTDAGESRRLVAFGLYVDYLNADTIAAYKCARDNDQSTACDGLRSRNPLEAIPFYAVNLANLGDWRSDLTSVVSVKSAEYNNQGTLRNDGGEVTAGSGASATAIAVYEEINVSNSGLATTTPIDPHDKDSHPDDPAVNLSFKEDLQLFERTGGTAPGTRYKIFIRTSTSSTLTLNRFRIASSIETCNYRNSTQTTTCEFDHPPGSTVLTFSGFTTTQGQTTTNRKVCLPTDDDDRFGTPVPGGTNGTTSETLSVEISNLAAQGHTLTIAVVGENDPCPEGLSLSGG
jgi:prepilin-type N-terminal cleavage/methylation domain-containing protein